MGGSSEVFVSNLIDLGYWKADKVTHKHFRATSYQVDNCSEYIAQYISVARLDIINAPIMIYYHILRIHIPLEFCISLSGGVVVFRIYIVS